MTGTTEIFTLIWILSAPVVSGGASKDQTVYFGTRTTYEDCRQMKRRLDEFTLPAPATTESLVLCIPVPK